MRDARLTAATRGPSLRSVVCCRDGPLIHSTLHNFKRVGPLGSMFRLIMAWPLPMRFGSPLGSPCIYRYPLLILSHSHSRCLLLSKSETPLIFSKPAFSWNRGSDAVNRLGTTATVSTQAYNKAGSRLDSFQKDRAPRRFTNKPQPQQPAVSQAPFPPRLSSVSV